MTEPRRSSPHPREETNESGAEMDFWEHIGELRKRLLYSALAIGFGAVVGWYISEQAFEILSEPFYAQFEGATLIGTGPAEAFILRLKIAFFLGSVLVSPILFLQLWLFISPGLLDHEKKLALPFVVVTTLLFLTGTSFCYSVVLPFTLEFFHAQYAALESVTPTIRVSEYLSLLLKALLGFGLVFQTPVLAFFLGRLGIITSQGLKDYGRYAIVFIFIISAILTPPDVLTQLLMAGPLLVLYGISIVIVKWTEPRTTDDN